MNDSLDRLKPFEEIAVADRRMAGAFVRKADRSKRAPLTIERYYELIADEQLPDHLPLEVQQQYETARNLHVYTWYCYRFWPVAVLQAFGTLEAGLRQALEEFDHKKMPTLSALLRRASDEGRLSSAGFRDKSLPMLGEPPGDDPERFVHALVKVVPLIRNEIAHGHQILWPDYLHTLRIVRDALVQLFNPLAKP